MNQTVKRKYRNKEKHLYWRRRKPSVIGIVSFFRIVLWWSTEIAQQIVAIRKPKPQIVRISRTNWTFPPSLWCFHKEKSYCLIARTFKREICIYELSGFGKN